MEEIAECMGLECRAYYRHLPSNSCCGGISDDRRFVAVIGSNVIVLVSAAEGEEQPCRGVSLFSSSPFITRKQEPGAHVEMGGFGGEMHDDPGLVYRL
jgi:hypothetical protein